MNIKISNKSVQNKKLNLHTFFTQFYISTINNQLHKLFNEYLDN